MTVVVQNRTRMGLQLLAVALCTILLLLPAIFNRAPFVYFDSGSYLSHAGKAFQLLQDRLGMVSVGEATGGPARAVSQTSSFESNDSVFAGRSIYYSFFAWTGAVTLGVGSVVVLQALVLTILIVMTLQTVWPGAPPASFLMVTVSLTGGLSLLTSAGFFVSLIMPDIWAGMMILAFALLMSGGIDLGRVGRSALGAVLALAALFHTSHLLLLAALMGLVAVAMLHPGWRRIVVPRRLVLPALALACGLAGHVAFSMAVTAVTGQSPLTRPFVTAHFVDMGPGARLAQETCPDSGFAICPYVDRLPTDWMAFLFSQDPETGVFAVVPPSVQRALSEEQARFALATLVAEPLATMAGLTRDGFAQLWHLSVDDVPLSERNEAFLAKNFSQEVAVTIRGSEIWDRPWVAPAMSRLIQVSTAFAVAGLFFLAFTGQLPRRGPLAMLLLMCVAGIVLNAMICGVLASPYGRFQARVAWLLPFLLILSLLANRFSAFVALKRVDP